jgi:hypothetical protein
MSQHIYDMRSGQGFMQGKTVTSSFYKKRKKTQRRGQAKKGGITAALNGG